MTVSTEAPGNALATIADKAGLPAGHASAILADFGPLMIQREDLSNHDTASVSPTHE